MKETVGYEIKKLSPVRQILADFNDVAAQMPHIDGLVEVDVTKARRLIKKIEGKEDYRISFTGWIIKCIGDAVNEHKRLNSFQIKRRQVVIFDNVDISVMIEIKDEKGQFTPYNHVVRKVETKTVREISDEIRLIQEKKIEGKEQVRRGSSLVFILYGIIPRFIRKALIRRRVKNPFYLQKTVGTVGLTSLGMFIKTISGWAIPFAIKTLNVAVGGMSEKPRIIDGKLENREYLSLTFMMNHNVVDGAPATRFIARTLELMKNGHGIE